MFAIITYRFLHRYSKISLPTSELQVILILVRIYYNHKPLVETITSVNEKLNMKIY